MLRYSIINSSTTEITNFHAGLFLDWDLIEGSGSGDITSWDALNNFGYVHNQSGTPAFYGGTALMAPSGYNFWAIQNNGTDNGFSIYDNFTDAEKWQALSSGIGKPSAGPSDISHVLSGGPYNINVGDTLEVGFMIGCASTLDSIRSTVSRARNQYYKIINIPPPVQNYTFQLLQNYPNPFNNRTNITFSIPSNEYVTLKIYDILGEEVMTLINGPKEAGPYTVAFNVGSLSSGVYIYKLQAGSDISTKKLLLLK